MNFEEIEKVIKENPELIGQVEQAMVEKEEPNNNNVAIIPAILRVLAMPQIQSLITLHIESKKQGAEIQGGLIKWDTILRYGLTFVAIIAGGVLSYNDKLDPTMGVLLGSVIGYMFGRKNG